MNIREINPFRRNKSLASASNQEHQALETVKIFAKDHCQGLLQIPDDEFSNKNFVEFIEAFLLLTGVKKEGNRTVSTSLIDESISRSETLFSESVCGQTIAGISLKFSYEEKDLSSMKKCASMPLVEEQLRVAESGQAIVDFNNIYWPRNVTGRGIHEYLFYSILADKNMTESPNSTQIENPNFAIFHPENPVVEVSPKRLKELAVLLFNNHTVYKHPTNHPIKKI